MHAKTCKAEGWTVPDAPKIGDEREASKPITPPYLSFPAPVVGSVPPS